MLSTCFSVSVTLFEIYSVSFQMSVSKHFISLSRSFPVNYWDKFAKKKVRQKYSETYDFDSISNLLGMEKTSFSSQENEEGSGIVYL